MSLIAPNGRGSSTNRPKMATIFARSVRVPMRPSSRAADFESTTSYLSTSSKILDDGLEVLAWLFAALAGEGEVRQISLQRTSNDVVHDFGYISIDRRRVQAKRSMYVRFEVNGGSSMNGHSVSIRHGTTTSKRL